MFEEGGEEGFGDFLISFLLKRVKMLDFVY